jgi:hypothetical protein
MKSLLLVLALCGFLPLARATVPVYVTIYNVGSASFVAGGSGWTIISGAACSKYVQGFFNGTATINPGNSATLEMDFYSGYWGGTCQDVATLNTPCTSHIIGNQMQTTFTISYDSGSCAVVTNCTFTYTPPTSTNVTQCIQNTSSHFVNATAKLGGALIASATLYPGQTWCITASVKLDGSSGNFGMGYTLSPLDNMDNPNDPNNPFATNGMNSDFSVTNGFSSTNFVPINPAAGNTNVMQGGGGSYTNTIYVGSTNFSSVLWTNNINYPNSGTAGDARDSTLKAGFGTLHNDNASTVAALKLIWTDTQGIKTLATMMTNQLGQVVAAIYHQTNNDQMPVYINSVTNNATANMQALKSQAQSDTAAITNAIAQGGNSSQLTNMNNTLGGISNLFSQITDMTNADIATETTQSGISNLLSQLNSNTIAGRLYLTNYALQTTLAEISSNLLGTADSNGEGLSNAIGALDVALADTNALVDDTNAGYTVTMLDSTNPVTVAANAAYNSLHADSLYHETETSFKSFIDSVVGPSVDDVAGITPMVVTFPYPGGSRTFDFNPLSTHDYDVSPLFVWAKSLFAWGLAVYYMLLCAKDSVKACELLMMGRGVVAQPPSVNKTISK